MRIKDAILGLFAVAFVSFDARADQPATHGMLLFGDKAIYASHLPMFHSPHDYQLLLKLKLENVPLSMTMMKYRTAKQRSETYFTLVPEPMDLSQVASGGKKTFVATIFEGHFERGGKRIGPVQVTVGEILYAQKLDANHTPETNRYLVFGENGEYFAAHLIDGKPNFDAIVSTGQPYQLVDGPCRSRVCKAPAKVFVQDGKLPLELAGGQTFKPPQANDVFGEFGAPFTDVMKVIYVEEAELSID